MPINFITQKDEFLERHYQISLKINVDNMNIPVYILKLKFIIKSLLTKKALPGLLNCTKHLR